MLASVVRPQRKTKARLEVAPRKAYMITRLICLLVILSACSLIAWRFGLLENFSGKCTTDCLARNDIWGRSDLVGAFDWRIRYAAGSNGVWRCDVDGDDRRIFGLAVDTDCLSSWLPFAALLIGLIQLIAVRRTDIAFGPYLALASVVLVVAWKPIWELRAQAFFQLGWFIPSAGRLLFDLNGTATGCLAVA